jgi:hypothetical protein
LCNAKKPQGGSNGFCATCLIKVYILDRPNSKRNISLLGGCYWFKAKYLK